MSARNAVEQTVLKHPGITFSDLKRETGLANGALQYHIHRSDRIAKEKGGLIPVGYCDRCGLQETCRERCIRTVLRNRTRRRIVEGLAAGEAQARIAENIGVDPSTVSYHVSRLQEAGALDETDPVPAVEQLLDR